MGVVHFERLPLKLAGIQWTGSNEDEIQDGLAGSGFQAVVQCDGKCDPPCKAKDHPEITGEVLNSFGDFWQGMETGWWVCQDEQGRLFPVSPDILEANYVRRTSD